jgi:pyruvate formate lyase activating enzyme
MQIATVVKCSLIDYPGKIAAVVFTPGCNLRCFFCHNRALIDADSVMCAMTPEKVVEWLRCRRGILDAVVVSGGEPTLQPGLAGFISDVRALGYLIKLDTNGTHPEVLASLIDAKLLDCVAMDIKASAEKYDAICGVSVDQHTIEKSIALLMNSQVDYEFRTTIVPQLTREDILAIGNRIRGARMYVLQRYRELVAGKFSRHHEWSSPYQTPSWLEDVQHRLGRMVKTCLSRGFELTSARIDQAH